MAKYSYAFKRKVVDEYLSGKMSSLELERKYSIDHRQVCTWVKNFQQFGDEGLVRSRNQRVYSVEFKLEAITRYETSERSYQELAHELGLNNASLIANWRRQYREQGIDGLRPKKRGRPMKRKQDTDPSSSNNETLDTSTREELENRIQELEAENRRLTIQKMFWEQLRSLEREEAMQKRRGSSPNSENNSR